MPSTVAEIDEVVCYIESVSIDGITGWAFRPFDAQPARLIIRIDGEQGPATVCDLPREDIWTEFEDVRNRSACGERIGFHVDFGAEFHDDRQHSLEILGENAETVLLRTAGGIVRSSWQFGWDHQLPATTVLGQVEPGPPGEPIHGWVTVLDRVTGEKRTGVEVIVRTLSSTIAILEASRLRPDVAEALGCAPACGFMFKPPEEILRSPRQNIFFTVMPEGVDLRNSPIELGEGASPAEDSVISTSSGAGTAASSPAIPAPSAVPADVGSDWPTLVALFVESHYSRVAGLGKGTYLEKLRHFAEIGLSQGLSPSPLFDNAVYLERAHKAGLPPLGFSPAILHWLKHGVRARIVPTQLFDEDFYLAHYPEISAENCFGFDHFITKGLFSDFRPNAWFDPQWYRSSLSDLPAGQPAFLHFLEGGADAGLLPNRLLRPVRLQDLTLEWWAAHGTALGRLLETLVGSVGQEAVDFLLILFQPHYYRLVARLPAGTTTAEGLLHFLSSGIHANLSPTPLFETEFYTRTWERSTGEPLTQDQDPAILHWLKHGRKIVPTPTRLFSESYYRNQYADMADLSIDVFHHYARAGVYEERRPNSWFEPMWYASQTRNRLKTTDPDYIAFLTQGGDIALASRTLWLLSGGPTWSPADDSAGRALETIEILAQLVHATEPWLARFTAEQIELAALLFAPEIYTGDGRLDAGVSPIAKLADFLAYEMATGEKVGPLFSPEFYRTRAAAEGVPVEAAMSPLLHFLEQGFKHRIVPTPLFDDQIYLEANPDLRSYPAWTFLHFVKDGLYEGRRCAEQPVIAFAPDFSAPPVESARRGVLTRMTGDIPYAALRLPAGLQRMMQAQRSVTSFLSSDIFSNIMKRAESIEPLVGATVDRRDLLVAPLHDTLASKFSVLRNRLQRDHYDHVICVPWLRAGGADLVSGHLSNALRELFPDDTILLLRTDQPHFERSDWLAPRVDVMDMSDITRVVTPAEAERLLFTLIRGLAPGAVYNVNSRLCWLFMRRFGKRFSAKTKLFAYLFCWDQTVTGVRVGYPSEFFHDTQACLTGLLTDTAYLKNELIRTYSLPDEVRNRIFPLSSPSRSESAGPTMAERGVATVSSRTRPCILWGGRLDLQKRFDLTVEIARQMPDCDFWCWGAAMLDLPPNLADLPPNITMMGIFKHLTDLPLAEAEGWLFTSAWEGMPTTIIELGVMGMPIIASAVGGIPELIDETTGWLVEPFDSVSGFVASLREMIENPQERIKRGRELQAQVRERYTMKSYKQALAKVIRPESS